MHRTLSLVPLAFLAACAAPPLAFDAVKGGRRFHAAAPAAAAPLVATWALGPGSVRGAPGAALEVAVSGTPMAG